MTTAPLTPELFETTLIRYLTLAMHGAGTVEPYGTRYDNSSSTITVQLSGEGYADLRKVPPILENLGLPYTPSQPELNGRDLCQFISFPIPNDVSTLERMDQLIQDEFIARINQTVQMGTAANSLVDYWLDIAKKFKTDRSAYDFDLSRIARAADEANRILKDPIIPTPAAAPRPQAPRALSLDELPPPLVNETAIAAKIRTMLAGFDDITPAPTPAAPTGDDKQHEGTVSREKTQGPDIPL